MAPNRIVLLRHGEKPGNPADPDDSASPNLAPAGVARAKMLATLIPNKFGHPDLLIAAANSDRSHRPAETLQPLADALHFGPGEFVTTYPNGAFTALAGDLLTRETFSAKLIIVCWHHGNIPGLALALRVSPQQIASAPEITHGKWNPLVFDRFWVIDYNGDQVAFHFIAQQPN
jgi:hypothetical protein